ncbi:MAG: hypothetical protein ACE5OZ_04950 [Candidatus Heimdallarchaeota archaeon]
MVKPSLQTQGITNNRARFKMEERANLHGHVLHSFIRLVVPPMEGWFGKWITAFARDLAGLTARLGNLTALKFGTAPPTTPGRRQDSGIGIIPRKHTPTPGKGALACSQELLVWTATT